MIPVDYIDEVNILGDKLTTVSDFYMSYENIKTDIYDLENDRAQFLLDGKIIAQYCYSGPRFYPFFVNPELLEKALKIMENIEIDL